MKSFFLSVAFFSFISINCFAQKSISVEDIWSKYAFRTNSVGGFNTMKDGLHYTDLEKDGDFDNIVKYELKSGKKMAVLVKGASVKVGIKRLILVVILLVRMKQNCFFQPMPREFTVVHLLKLIMYMI